MKILELCLFSEGACGVWARAREESLRLSELGHEVKVFSTNAIKGKDSFAPSADKIEKVDITRFPFAKLGGESFMFWNFRKEALKYKPDVIIAHNYRHLHTTKALKIANILNKSGHKCKVFLVTHAPFVEGNITRTRFQTLIVNLYDKTIGRATINRFNKILSISHWEESFLFNLGLKKENLVYIPNGIPEEFFSQKKSKEEDKILFLGRISIKKNLQTLVEAMSLIKNKKITLEIVGPQEKGYAEKIISLVKRKNLQNRIKFSAPIYDIEKKIKKIDSAKLFVLPSRVEGMPQALIEAMSRGKLVIGSDSMAIRDLIKDNQNGFLFEFNNPQSLAKEIERAISKSNVKIKKNARDSVKNFNWKNVIDKIEKTIIS